ncbi:hypothetical protein ACF0H5_013320 [Mactra antiquata]
MAFILQSNLARRGTDVHNDLLHAASQNCEENEELKRNVKTHGPKHEKPEYHFGWRSSGLVFRSKKTHDNVEDSVDNNINVEVVDNSPSSNTVEEDTNTCIYEDPFTTKTMTHLPHPKELFGKQRKVKKRSHRHISSFDSHIQLIHQKQAKM